MRPSKPEIKGSKPRLCFLDIESTDLVADFGTVLCTSWKFLGEAKVHTRTITDYPSFSKRPWDDRLLVRDIVAGLADADIYATWYGKRFDIPFLNTRLIYHKMNPMPPLPHWDGWEVARYKLKMRRNRLASVSEFLGLDDKTPVRGDVWVKARSGHGPSVKYVVDHCEKDVEVLEQAYNRIKALTAKHPNMTLLMGADRPRCPVCTSTNVQRRGTNFNLTRKSQRYQCRDCGKWSSATTESGRTNNILRP